MRVSSGFIFENQRRNVQSNFAEMVRWQNALSSGKQVEKLSDDPFRSGLLLKQRSLRTAVEQYNANLRVGKDYLGNSEQALTEMQKLINKGYELAVQGANSTMEQSARLALADQVAQMQQRFVQLANSRGSEGQYLFGGQVNNSAPYTMTGTTLQYNGDANDIRIETGPIDTMKVNTTGGPNFVNAYNALEALKVNLTGGNMSALSGIDVPALQGQIQQFSRLRSEAGAAMQQIRELETTNQRRMDDLTEGISEIEDVDISEAVMKLKQAETAYQASLQVTSTSFRLSLLDYLR